ncbi:porin [Congregibacter brevis]|uniref:Porin n=1 Tax=Congregibacter brevis TaxID=3081201 RepID=A0ABZ0I8B3_9GAMM|nr:porin [Congregibacter sp. IMCC45268]
MRSPRLEKSTAQVRSRAGSIAFKRKRSKTSQLIAALIVLVANLAYAAPDLLIRNVKLLDLTPDSPDRLVTLQFENGKLTLVTEDNIKADDLRQFDAAGGVVLGDLALNEEPDLIILSEDPRDNFAVLRDTQAHTLFAMERGEVTVNRLRLADGGESKTEKNSGWLAYTPPPFAVPIRYGDKKAFNHLEGKLGSAIFGGALAVDRTKWLAQDVGSKATVGDLDEFSGGEIRALRFGVAGTINFEKPWVYVIAGATNAFDKGFEIEDQDDVAFFDIRLDIPGPGDTTLSIGKQKEPISLERLTGMVFLPFQERSIAADALLPSRNTGAVWSGNGPSKRTTWAVGAFNDWLDSDVDFSDNANQFVGRVTWAPSLSGDEDNLLHLGVGYRYTDAKEGLRFRSEPEFNKAPNFVDTGRNLETGLYDADNAELWNFEASWRAGPFWLNSECFTVESKSPTYEDPSFNGYSMTASWSLSGEMREYDYRRGLFRSLPVAKSVYQGGWGAAEMAVRFSSVDLDDGLINGGTTDVASLGFNWWLTPTFQFGVNYRYIWNNLDGIDGTSSGIGTRLLLILE